MNAKSKPEVQLQVLEALALDEVVAIEQRAYSHPWSRGNFEDSLRSGYHLRSLTADGVLLGYFVAMQGVEEVHLLNITVDPAYQGQGLAVLMLDALRLWALSLGAACIWLEVRKSNDRARAVYTRYGYAEVGVRKNYYPNGHAQREDAVVMSLKL
jgi:[ribosomal protein S18]-alanine N-acetyltransferase